MSFKLLKYEIYWPEIVNKVLNPTTMIVEMNKKLLLYEKMEEGSSIKAAFAQDQVGRKISLMVRHK